MITLEKEKVTVNPDIKVIKRDGTETPFYAYKLNLIFKSLDADWATQQSVCQALSQAFKDQAPAKVD